MKIVLTKFIGKLEEPPESKIIEYAYEGEFNVFVDLKCKFYVPQFVFDFYKLAHQNKVDFDSILNQLLDVKLSDDEQLKQLVKYIKDGRADEIKNFHFKLNIEEIYNIFPLPDKSQTKVDIDVVKKNEQPQQDLSDYVDDDDCNVEYF